MFFLKLNGFLMKRSLYSGMQFKLITLLAASVFIVSMGILSLRQLDASDDLNSVNEGLPVSPYLIGFNLSYFNDLDDIWEEYDIPSKLQTAGAVILRYPGGEETSRWQWDQPGVNGYVDAWNLEHHQQEWQSTWVSPDQWSENTRFMDIDEYFTHCIQIGAEPLLGVNMTAGEVNDRREDAIQSAVRMIEHVKAAGYPLQYVYFDNEPWHKNKNNYYPFPGDDYAELCVLYAEALRAVLPTLKVVVNPFEAHHEQNPETVRRFMDIAGAHIDVINMHYYWEWGRSSWDHWVSQIPMKNSSTWRTSVTRTYSYDLNNLRNILTAMGYPSVELAVLEWNIAPPSSDDVLTQSQRAIMLGEMLMQFIDANVTMTALWPTFWQVVPPEDANRVSADSMVVRGFHGILEPQPPYQTTKIHDLFSLFRGIPGSMQLDTRIQASGVYEQCYRLADGRTVYMILNKSGEPQGMSLEIANEVLESWSYIDPQGVASIEPGLGKLPELPQLSPFSLNRIVCR